VCIFQSARSDCCTECTAGLTDDFDKLDREFALPNVELFDLPNTVDFNETAFCGSIWNSNSGTCCNQTTLIARATEWKTRLQTRYNWLLKSLDKFDKILGNVSKMKGFINKRKGQLSKSSNTLQKDQKRPPLGGELLPEVVITTNPGTNQAGAGGASPGGTNTQGTGTSTGGVGGTNTQGTGANTGGTSTVGAGGTNTQGTGANTGGTNTGGTSTGGTNTQGTGANTGGTNTQGTGTGTGGRSRILQSNITNDSQRTLMSDDDISEISEAFEEFDSTSKRQEASNRREKAKTQFSKCFETLTRLRFNALCLRCSGDASNYFDTDTLVYKISKGVCTTLIVDCGSLYGVLFEANRVYDAVLRAKGGLGEVSGNPELPEGDNLRQFPIDKTISIRWATCADDPESCSQDSDNSDLICKDFTLSLPSPVENSIRAVDAEFLVSKIPEETADGGAARMLASTFKGDGYGAIEPSVDGVDLVSLDSGDTNFSFVEQIATSSDIVSKNNTSKSNMRNSHLLICQEIILMAAILSIILAPSFY